MTLEQGAGAALLLVFLADIFLTALYARAGTGLLAPYWNRAVWAAVRGVATLFGRRRGRVLSFAGPLIVVLLIGFWAFGLTLGAALVIHPELGSAITPSTGRASTDFVTALLVAGNSLSIVGGGDYAPHTAGARLLFLADSLIGTAVLSLVLSYLVQVYSALRERNALALAIDLMTDGSGDAAEMLARLLSGGDASTAVSELGGLVRPLAATKEAHHFYPLLFYFRFDEPLYAVSRFTFVLLDLTALIGSALDQERYGALANSGPVASLRRGSALLLRTLDQSFPSARTSADEEAEAAGRRRSFVVALETLARAGVATRPEGADAYLADRRRWEAPIRRIAPALGYTMDEVDRRGAGSAAPVAADGGVAAARTGQRAASRARPHGIGGTPS